MKRCVAFTALLAAVTAAPTSNLIFTHQSGNTTRLSYDGTTLSVPDTCSEDQCVQHGVQLTDLASQLASQCVVEIFIFS